MIKVISILIAVLAIGVSAQLAIPLPEEIAVAPVTGQTLAVLMVSHLLKWRQGSVSILLYLTLGGIGLPLFSDFSSGWEVVQGPSLGYFIGFFISSLAVGRLAEKQSKSFINYLGQFTIGSILILICGILGLLRFLSFYEALSKGVIPFLPGALIKIFIGAILLSIISRFQGLMNNSELQGR